jgi:hypothetical protein
MHKLNVEFINMTFIRKTNSLMKFIDSNPLEFYFDFSILTSNNFI